MAIKKMIELPTGDTAEYLKIIKLEASDGNKELVIHIAPYKDSISRNTKQPHPFITRRIDLDDFMKYAYQRLKLTDEFIGTEDV